MKNNVMDMMFSQPRKSKPVKSSALSMKEFKMPNYDISSKHMKVKSSTSMLGNNFKTNFRDISSAPIVNKKVTRSVPVKHTHMKHFETNALGNIKDPKLGMVIGDKVTSKQRTILKSNNWDKIWTDSDKDGVINGLDCDPMNKNKHGFFAKAKNLLQKKGFKEHSTVAKEKLEENIAHHTRQIYSRGEAIKHAEELLKKKKYAREEQFENIETKKGMADRYKRALDEGELVNPTHKKLFEAYITKEIGSTEGYVPEIKERDQNLLRKREETLERVKTQTGKAIKDSTTEIKQEKNKIKDLTKSTIIPEDKTTWQETKELASSISEKAKDLAYAAKENVKRGLKREALERGYYSLQSGVDKSGNPIVEKTLDPLRYIKQKTAYFLQDTETRNLMQRRDAELDLAMKHKFLAGVSPQALKAIGALTATEKVPLVIDGVVQKDKSGNVKYTTREVAPNLSNLTPDKIAALNQLYEEKQRMRPIQMAQESAALQQSKTDQLEAQINAERYNAALRESRMAQAQNIADSQPRYIRKPLFEAGPLNEMFISGKRFPGEYQTPYQPSDVAILDTMAIQNKIPNMQGRSEDTYETVKRQGFLDKAPEQIKLPSMMEAPPTAEKMREEISETVTAPTRVQTPQPLQRTVQRFQPRVSNKPRIRPPEKPIGYRPDGTPIMRSHHKKPENQYRKPEYKESKHIDKDGKEIKNKFEDED